MATWPEVFPRIRGFLEVRICYSPACHLPSPTGGGPRLAARPTSIGDEIHLDGCATRRRDLGLAL
eukprot:1116511-Pyramimonas_sp.AAC.1